MSHSDVKKENYLDKIPVRGENLHWSVHKDGLVTLDIENKGIFHRFAQKYFHKPKITHIHLDTMGSYVWSIIDGTSDIYSLSLLVKEQFGDEASPLYERLSKYFQILQSYGFIKMI